MVYLFLDCCSTLVAVMCFRGSWNVCSTSIATTYPFRIPCSDAFFVPCTSVSLLVPYLVDVLTCRVVEREFSVFWGSFFLGLFSLFVKIWGLWIAKYFSNLVLMEQEKLCYPLTYLSTSILKIKILYCSWAAKRKSNFLLALWATSVPCRKWWLLFCSVWRRFQV